MSKASKSSASEHVEMEGFTGHYAELGGYTVGWENYSQDADLTPLFVGLPDDRCQCEHWGYVVTGAVTFKTHNGEETFEAGDAYYVAPGHTPVLTRGTEVIEFSPTVELRRTLDVVAKNMESG